MEENPETLDPSQRIERLLLNDNQLLSAQRQSFEKPIEKSWEKNALGSRHLYIDPPPLFQSLQTKLQTMKRHQEHLQQHQQLVQTVGSIHSQTSSALPHTASTSTSSLSTAVSNTGLKQDSTSNRAISSNEIPSSIASSRDILRSVCLCVDISDSSLEKDLLPTRFDCLLTLAASFITAFLEQHPLSELTSLTVAQGHATVRTPPRQACDVYCAALRQCQDKQQEKGGVFSIQNTLHACAHLLQLSPPQSSKEIILLTCSLHTIDVGEIATTIQYCKKSNIVVHIIGLDAQVHLFDRIARETGGNYIISCSNQEFHTALFSFLPAPVRSDLNSNNALRNSTSSIRRGWLPIAFPSLETSKQSVSLQTQRRQQQQQQHQQQQLQSQDQSNETQLTLICFCHQRPCKSIFRCPVCNAAVCQIPSQCPVCRILLVSYPIIARSASQLWNPPPSLPLHIPPALIDWLFPYKNSSTDELVHTIIDQKASHLHTKTQQVPPSSSIQYILHQRSILQQLLSRATHTPISQESIHYTKKQQQILGLSRRRRPRLTFVKKSTTSSSSSSSSSFSSSSSSIAKPVFQPNDYFIRKKNAYAKLSSMTFPAAFISTYFEHLYHYARVQHASSSHQQHQQQELQPSDSISNIVEQFPIPGTTSFSLDDIPSSAGTTPILSSSTDMSMISPLSGPKMLQTGNTTDMVDADDDIPAIRDDTGSLATTMISPVDQGATFETNPVAISSSMPITEASPLETTQLITFSCDRPRLAVPSSGPPRRDAFQYTQSASCVGVIVPCQGCQLSLIVPSTHLLEQAVAYCEGATQLLVCTCHVCTQTDLVCTCTRCGAFLCPDCDQLIHDVLQNCPGCDLY